MKKGGNSNLPLLPFQTCEYLMVLYSYYDFVSFSYTRCHTHGAEHIIIFKGDPSKFALGQKYSKRDPWTPKHVHDVDSVANELIQSASEAGIGHCKGNIQWQGEEIRMTQINCKPWQFKEGDIAAIAILYDPVRRPYTNLRQHLIFRGDWYPDEPNIADRRPDLMFENTKFCGENPNHCVSHASLGYKMYMVIVNRGWMPEYYLHVVVVGWLILVIFFGLMLLGVYKFFKWLVKMTASVHSSTTGQRSTSKYEVVALSETNEAV